MTQDGGGWTLVFSSNAVDGSSEERGTLDASPTQATMTPDSQQVGVHTVLPEVDAIRFACDKERDGIMDVDFFYSLETSANGIYQLFKQSSSEADFAGASNTGLFGGQPFYDFIDSSDGTTVNITMRLPYLAPLFTLNN